MSPTAARPAKTVAETDVGYANARLRGMKAHLLPRTFYDRIIATDDLSSAIQQLMETDYAADLESELARGRSAGIVDDALKANIIRTYRKVFEFIDPGSRRLLTTLLGRWDVFNVKTILRAAQHHVSFVDMKASLFPVGYLSGEELESLAKLEDIRTIADTMATWGLPYAVPLSRAYPEYARTNDLTLLELALDRQYAEWAASRLTGRNPDVAIARQIMGMQTDILNLVMVFRLLDADAASVKAGDYFLEGGRCVNRKLFLELSSLGDVDDVLARLKRTPYAATLDAAALRYLEFSSIPVFERALEDLLVRKALKAGVNDPHGVGVAISFLYGKQNEVTNLRIIVKGKAVGMPAERVKEELILV